MLSKQINRLLESLYDYSATPRDIARAGKDLLDVAERRPRAASADALIMLTPHLLMEDLSRAVWVGVICGALIERGCEAGPAGEAILRRLREILAGAYRLVEAALDRLTEPGEDGGDHRDRPPDARSEAGQAAFDKALAQAAEQMPREHLSWTALDMYWRPSIAVLERSAAARAGCRDLRPLTRTLAPYSEAGHWLDLMLAVLDDQPMLIIEPATRLGLTGMVTGIADNFQLNMILMADFPQGNSESPPRLVKRAAAVARGEGRAAIDDIVTGCWNLYSWQAGPMLAPARGTAAAEIDRAWWIWNEGRPEEIPVFDEYRVVLLGPAAYPRSWRASRQFANLTAAINSQMVLGTSAVEQWLERFRQAA